MKAREKDTGPVIVIHQIWTASSLEDGSFIRDLVLFLFHDKLNDLISKRLYYSYMSIRRVCSLVSSRLLDYETKILLNSNTQVTPYMIISVLTPIL